MTRDKLISIFNETRSLSMTIYKLETIEAVKNTEVIIDGSSLLNKKVCKAQKIDVVNKGTIQAGIGVDSKRKVAILNFADPFTEGGLVYDGAETQEECICRCSNLYETLIKKECWDKYYKYNRNLDNNIFSDRCIYSKGITVFRDENYNIIFNPSVLDVISCPAPICCNDIAIFEKRIKCIIGAAYSQGVDTLILGAIGCGAFGNSAELVANAFKNVLSEYKLFDRIIFAIRCTEGIPSNNFEVFKKVLG